MRKAAEPHSWLGYRSRGKQWGERGNAIMALLHRCGIDAVK